ncbi:hypothetical protein R1flu_006501 [Riccia fluitans]|uniref:Katanin p80 WD40 repeat-containing subunit B1 homolog n=1 Tax=Riccia fluitans TaxID=41844 RepID=A0ABD1YZ73_9MARC
MTRTQKLLSNAGEQRVSRSGSSPSTVVRAPEFQNMKGGNGGYYHVGHHQRGELNTWPRFGGANFCNECRVSSWMVDPCQPDGTGVLDLHGTVVTVGLITRTIALQKRPPPPLFVLVKKVEHSWPPTGAREYRSRQAGAWPASETGEQAFSMSVALWIIPSPGVVLCDRDETGQRRSGALVKEQVSWRLSSFGHGDMCLSLSEFVRNLSDSYRQCVMTKRAYKLQEFVAHSSNVNCLTIGKKSSRVLVTGGEDQKVNMWAIGKPNAILSLTGHTSAVESVTFDASEVLVVAGAASGTIKLWDLEEAKILRTLTGHRSNCVSVSFHPFGEFFASGSLDTNLKIWDIRRKSCIHTYKGHTRGINTIKFSPDGKWVVSGGEDNAVKLWDLTAGKLMHDFKFHDGQIQALDFHPHEFLLASGSADRTVKFWDLETFQLIGSSGPETTGVRSMVFNPDGRALLCGMHESLKVMSWEPLRCHDVVDVGWSKLADLTVHEGKLLGASFQQSCVGVWVVDLMRVYPFQTGHVPREAAATVSSRPSTNGHHAGQQTASGNQFQTGHTPREASTSVNSRPSTNGHSASQQVAAVNTRSNGSKTGLPDMLESAISTMKEVTLATSKTPENASSTPSRINTPLTNRSTYLPASSQSPAVGTPRRSTSSRVHPSLVRSSSRSELRETPISSSAPDVEQSPQLSKSRSEGMPCSRSSGGLASLAGKPEHRSLEGLRGDAGGDVMRIDSARIDPHPDVTTTSTKEIVNGDRGVHDGNPPVVADRGTDDGNDQPPPPWQESRKVRRNPSFGLNRIEVLHKGPPPSQTLGGDINVPQVSRPTSSLDASTTGRHEASRARGLIAHWEKKEKSEAWPLPSMASNGGVKPLGLDINSYIPRSSEISGSSDEDLIDKLMHQHHTMSSIMQSRLTNMQVIRRFWAKNDIKGAMEAMAKLKDPSVLLDVLGVIMERSNHLSLEVCVLLLPLLYELLCSDKDRHNAIAIPMISKLVKTFGPVIHATISVAAGSLGVDLQAEQRYERCKLCHRELQQINRRLTALMRKGGEIATSAQELCLAIKEI